MFGVPDFALVFPAPNGHNTKHIRSLANLPCLLHPRENVMNRFLVPAFVALGLFPNLGSALEIKNIRPSYGPFGATRSETKLLPGDVMFISYELDGLGIDPKTSKTNYDTTLEFVDAKDKVLFMKKNPNNELLPMLGTGRMPGDLHIIVPPGQPAGKYAIRFTVHDRVGKEAKVFTYPIEVLPQGFGFVGVTAPAIGLPGQHYVLGFGVVNLATDKKSMPSAEVSIKIMDDKGTAVVPAVKYEWPRDMPDGIDLSQANFVPVSHSIFLNRPGRFRIEIRVNDKFGTKMAEMTYPMTVIDVNTYVTK